MPLHACEREAAIRQQPAVRPVLGALSRNAGNAAVARLSARSRLDRTSTPPQPQLVSLQVGSRSGPARHAVYRVGGVVHGLGDESLGPDTDGTGYRWATTPVLITQA